MALLHIEGFDLPTFASVIGGQGIPASSGSGQSVTMQPGRSSGRCLRVAGSTTLIENANYGMTFTLTLPASSSTFALGHALRRVTPNATEQIMFAVGQGNGFPQLSVTYQHGTGTWRLKRNNSAGVLLGDALFPITIGAWYYLELYGTIAGGTSGAATLSVNGTPLITVTGVNTQQQPTAAITSYLTAATEGYGATRYHEVDDLYFKDDATPLGDRVVRTIRPDSVGVSSGWSPVGASTGWQAASDDSDASYAQAAVVGTRDLYGLGTPNLDAVDGVQVQGRVSKSSEGTPAGGVLSALRGDGGTITTPTLATAAAITSTPTWQQGTVRTLDPDGDAWTPAGVEALQAGPQVG